jgi:hypothetical protein
MNAGAAALLIFALACALPAATGRLIDTTVRVQPAGIQPVDLTIPPPGGRLSCEYSVLGDAAGVRLVLAARAEAARWKRGEGHSILAATSYAREGILSPLSPRSGDYSLVIDNRLEGRGAAVVRLRCVLLPAPPPEAVRRAHPVRAQIAVWSSVLLFGTICWFAGLRIRRAVERRDALESRSGWLPPFD